MTRNAGLCLGTEPYGTAFFLFISDADTDGRKNKRRATDEQQHPCR
jgi:hypothetical protein